MLPLVQEEQPGPSPSIFSARCPPPLKLLHQLPQSIHDPPPPAPTVLAQEGFSSIPVSPHPVFTPHPLPPNSKHHPYHTAVS